MIEQLYQDFTNHLLPKIQEGLVISKDYFVDLFGRYVHYLIVTDAIKCLVGLLMIIGTCFLAKKLWKHLDEYDRPVLLLLIIPLTLGGLIFFDNGMNLIKDIYIPEIRIIEILNLFQK